MGNGPVLFWTAPKAKKWGDEANKFVVYRFKKGEKVNLSDPSAIVAVTWTVDAEIAAHNREIHLCCYIA